MFEASEENPIITFGDHTRIFYKRTNIFSVLDNVKVLRLKPEYKDIDIDFIIYNWEPKIQNLGYSRHWKEAKNLSVQIPINKKGKFDIEAQKLIADKYQKIENIKKYILAELDRIPKTEIDFE